MKARCMRLRKADMDPRWWDGEREINPDVGFRNARFTTRSGMVVVCDDDGVPVLWSEPRAPRRKGPNRKRKAP
jgi:hypothetical protein